MKGKSVFKINVHLAASHVCAGNYKYLKSIFSSWGERRGGMEIIVLGIVVSVFAFA
jgi:hypothetical protein